MLISEGWQWGRPFKGEGTSKLLREAKGREYGRNGPTGMRGVAISVGEGDTAETTSCIQWQVRGRSRLAAPLCGRFVWEAYDISLCLQSISTVRPHWARRGQ